MGWFGGIPIFGNTHIHKDDWFVIDLSLIVSIATILQMCSECKCYEWCNANARPWILLPQDAVYMFCPVFGGMQLKLKHIPVIETTVGWCGIQSLVFKDWRWMTWHICGQSPSYRHIEQCQKPVFESIIVYLGPRRSMESCCSLLQTFTSVKTPPLFMFLFTKLPAWTCKRGRSSSWCNGGIPTKGLAANVFMLTWIWLCNICVNQ